jgi:hypothetical protein
MAGREPGPEDYQVFLGAGSSFSLAPQLLQNFCSAFPILVLHFWQLSKTLKPQAGQNLSSGLSVENSQALELQ